MRICTDPRHQSHCDADCPACLDECGAEFAVEAPACPMCGDAESTYLSQLGRTHWFRCRACGWEVSA